MSDHQQFEDQPSLMAELTKPNAGGETPEILRDVLAKSKSKNEFEQRDIDAITARFRNRERAREEERARPAPSDRAPQPRRAQAEQDREFVNAWTLPRASSLAFTLWTLPMENHEFLVYSSEDRSTGRTTRELISTPPSVTSALNFMHIYLEDADGLDRDVGNRRRFECAHYLGWMVRLRLLTQLDAERRAREWCRCALPSQLVVLPTLVEPGPWVEEARLILTERARTTRERVRNSNQRFISSREARAMSQQRRRTTYQVPPTRTYEVDDSTSSLLGEIVPTEEPRRSLLRRPKEEPEE